MTRNVEWRLEDEDLNALSIVMGGKRLPTEVPLHVDASMAVPIAVGRWRETSARFAAVEMVHPADEEDASRLDSTILLFQELGSSSGRWAQLDSELGGLGWPSCVLDPSTITSGNGTGIIERGEISAVGLRLYIYVARMAPDSVIRFSVGSKVAFEKASTFGAFTLAVPERLEQIAILC